MAEARRHGAAEVYGRSVEGRELLAIDVGGDGPAVVVTAGIHGPEYVGVATALAVLKAGPIPGARLWVCPVLNPDAYARTWRQQGRGRMRRNARGVDLNRNFPLPWGARPSALGLAGSDDPDAATYRGASPLSEPETAALAAWMTAHRPHASANLHSFMGTLIAARVWHLADWRGYTRLVRGFRRGQGTWPGYRRLGTPIFDVFTGELEDWQHHVLQCWGVCVECFGLGETFRQHWRAPRAFWRFNPRDPTAVVARDANGVRGMLVASLDLPRPPRRPGAARTLTTFG